jgi:hypothetical protein
MKAKIVSTDDRVIGDRATNDDLIENVQGRVSTDRVQKRKWRSDRVDMIGAVRARRIDIGKISNIEIDLIQSSDRWRQSRSNFRRAWLLSRTSSPKLNPAPLPTRSLRSRGSFWRKRPGTTFN